MNILTVKNLSKEYPKFTLQNVSFSVQQGRIMGLIGRNGAGKTTTLKSILNLVCPQSGTITICGKSFPKEEIACKQEIGVVFGGINFYQHKKLKDITIVTRRFYEKWDEDAYKHYIKEFELDPQKQVKQLSSGMRVKYMIALALSHNASLLIMDEPTSGLDPVSRDDLLELFKQLVKNGERSILFSTHITSDLDKCADDITYIKNGIVLASAVKSDFIHSFQHLKNPEDIRDLNLEEIMLRVERRDYNV